MWLSGHRGYVEKYMVQKMTIGFDAKRAFRNFTGLGNYSRYVIDLLTRFYPENRYLAYSPSASSGRAVKFAEGHPCLTAILPEGGWKHFRSMWRTFGITGRLSSDGVSVYHGLSNELPLNIKKAGNVRTVVTMHDVIYLTCPECYPAVDRLTFNYKYRKACKNADAIIAVSECTKRDVVRYYRIDPEKITVVYQGCDESFRRTVGEDELAAVREKYSLPAKFVLNVGTIERRKNALTLVKALKALPEDIHLVLVGKKTKYADEVSEYAAANGLSGRLKFICDVDFADLPAIYHLALVFAYPSRYEGFGIPVLESLCCGTPVIAATGSCLEEAGGAGSVYLDPDDVAGFAGEINRLSGDASARKVMAEKGKAYAERFTDERLSADLMNFYKKLMK